MIYAKNNPIPSDCGKRYRQCFEYMFCFQKGQPKTFNPIMQPIKQEKAFKSFRITKVGRNDLAHDHVAPKERKVNNIFFYNVGTSSSKDKIAFEHPAIFPEQLVDDQIRPGPTRATSFTTVLWAAAQRQRSRIADGRWLGSEISAEYIKIARARLAELCRRSRNFRRQNDNQIRVSERLYRRLAPVPLLIRIRIFDKENS